MHDVKIGQEITCTACDKTFLAETTGCSVNYAHRGETFVCLDCAYGEELRIAETAVHFFAYLSSDGRAITDWHGNALARVTRNWDVSNNFAGTVTRVRAVTREGRKLYGCGPGEGMYIRMHANKVRTR